MQTMKDAYESRVGGSPRLVRRMEPTLYGGGDASGPLTQSQLKHYAEKGFLLLPQFFPESAVVRFQEELDRLQRLKALRRSPAVIRERDGDEIRSIFAVHRLSAVFGEPARSGRLVDLAEQILGSPVYIHQSRINLKPGFDGKEFYWHSDFETWHVEDGMPAMRALSCFITLTHNSDLNGPLMVIPGSHEYFVSCVGKTPDDNFKTSLQKQVYGVPDHETVSRLASAGGITALTGPPGTLAIFDCNLLHGSNGNITPFPRSNIFLVYNSTKNVLVEPFGGGPPRPEFLACRRPDPLRVLGRSA